MSAKEKRITKLYDCLEDMERLNLSLAAFARGDEEEVKTLRATCPKKHYWALDLDYVCLSATFERVMNHFILRHTKLFWSSQLFALRKNTFAMFCMYEDGRYEDKSALLAIISSIKDKGREDIKDKAALINFEKQSLIGCEAQIAKFSQLQDMDEVRERQSIAELKALHEGFRVFCLEVGIDHQSALACLKQSTANQEITEDQSQNLVDAQPDALLIEKVKKEFLALWG